MCKPLKQQKRASLQPVSTACRASDAEKPLHPNKPLPTDLQATGQRRALWQPGTHQQQDRRKSSDNRERSDQELQELVIATQPLTHALKTVDFQRLQAVYYKLVLQLPMVEEDYQKSQNENRHFLQKLRLQVDNLKRKLEFGSHRLWG